MRRLSRVLTAAIIGTGSALAPAVSYAQPQTAGAPQTARAVRGAISGTVHDERGGPLHGAMVTALGATMAMTISDEKGQFSIDALPVGEYILRANLTGFASSQRELVRVGMSRPATHRLQLRRLDSAVGTTGTVTPVSSRPIMAAGFGLAPVTVVADG
ncbi:MAG: carboxypeptidase-like regulatory domain-containing protein [Acidobacteria bacterium]|nr:carboxypeptidase-like regulatory domain-containing protein [Acidobacteriota bacterium]